MALATVGTNRGPGDSSAALHGRDTRQVLAVITHLLYSRRDFE